MKTPMQIAINENIIDPENVKIYVEIRSSDREMLKRYKGGVCWIEKAAGRIIPTGQSSSIYHGHGQAPSYTMRFVLET